MTFNGVLQGGVNKTAGQFSSGVVHIARAWTRDWFRITASIASIITEENSLGGTSKFPSLLHRPWLITPDIKERGGSVGVEREKGESISGRFGMLDFL